MDRLPWISLAHHGPLGFPWESPGTSSLCSCVCRCSPTAQWGLAGGASPRPATLRAEVPHLLLIHDSQTRLQPRPCWSPDPQLLPWKCLRNHRGSRCRHRPVRAAAGPSFQPAVPPPTQPHRLERSLPHRSLRRRLPPSRLHDHSPGLILPTWTVSPASTRPPSFPLCPPHPPHGGFLTAEWTALLSCSQRWLPSAPRTKSHSPSAGPLRPGVT